MAPVHPIAEEADSIRGSIRNAQSMAHSSYASSNNIPIGIPGYYLEERGSGYSHPSAAMGRPSIDSGYGHPMGRPSVDSGYNQTTSSRSQLAWNAEAYDEPLEPTYESRREDERGYTESPSPEPAALIRQASLGKRTKPTLTTVRSGERMGREDEGQQQNFKPQKENVPPVTRDMMRDRSFSDSSSDEDLKEAERSGQGEKALEAASAANAGFAAAACGSGAFSGSRETSSVDSATGESEGVPIHCRQPQ